jgi:hypothetical protein
MAKGKHSAALFEVIKGSNTGRSDGVSLRTPKWWFKSRPATSNPAETPASHDAPEPSAPAVSTMAAPRTHSRPASSSAGSSRSSAVHMDFDRSRKEITFRLRYTTALVSAFGVCALIGSAYVIGRHLNRGPQSASAGTIGTQTLPQYARQAPQPGVTEVSRQHVSRPMISNNVQTKPNIETPAPPPPRESASLSLVPTSAETRLPRTIGLNYVIIQTYPDEEKKTAQATCDFLTKNGIPCTLEQTEYARNWTCLVGTAGFTRISSADFKSYVDNIVRIGEKFPSSHFDHIKPAAYKWKPPVSQ